MSSGIAEDAIPSRDQLAVESVVSAVADAKGVAETDIAPLYEAVDPDALERVLRTGTRATVGFEFEGYEVTVHGDGHVELDR